jgi:hypothetical protein
MDPGVERQHLEFLPGVAGKLGWYVYALRDPRDSTVFYVGKGPCGDPRLLADRQATALG